ncbi:MAG: Holliday junction branch migration protein RuvA [Chloroflexota bacterium]
MIVTLEGTLTAASHTFAIVDVGGVGLRALIPASTAAHLPPVGERVRLFTHLRVREDDLSLYGFSSAGELELFEHLLSVSGLGPTKSLAIISGSPVDAIRTYIWTENTVALSKVPGVGARTAARIILDLKSKIGPLSPTSTTPSVDAELLSWLTTLGFPAADAQRVVASLPRDPAMPFEEKARKALDLLRPG